ncbi:hypothetical protein [Streptomyces sp. NPDC004783]|uniref:hypothetical protein n=1 Tax=Streptomyces sp. NPDC004783 TaxID=3154459 RepID=UPI0033A72532
MSRGDVEALFEARGVIEAWATAQSSLRRDRLRRRNHVFTSLCRSLRHRRAIAAAPALGDEETEVRAARDHLTSPCGRRATTASAPTRPRTETAI